MANETQKDSAYAGITGDCEPPIVDTRRHTLRLSETSSKTLTTEPPLQPWNPFLT